jgi:AcrR family transcriptional regulator
METRIIESAIRVFGDRGFQPTTMREIASGAGISSGSVYTYFPDKEGLFRAAVSSGWERFILELEQLKDLRGDRETRIALLLDRGFSILEEALPLLRGMLFDASRQGLVEPCIARVCAAIDDLVKPDADTGNGQADENRRNLIAIIVHGILFTGALGKGLAGARVEPLKKAVLSLLKEYGIAAPEKQGPKAGA